MESQNVQYTEAARSLANRARSLGLKSPVFRSPPRIVGLTRTVRYRPDGHAVVSIAFRGRPWSAVLADMIDGVMLVNELGGPELARARDELWQIFDESLAQAA